MSPSPNNTIQEQITQLDEQKQNQLAEHTEKIVTIQHMHTELELKYHTLIDDYNTMQVTHECV